MKWGVVLNAQKPVPVYHAVGGRVVWDHEGDESVVLTKCGRKVGVLASWLPEHHLKRFSKRCRGCYPR
jgi:hypothetical protein